MLLTYIILSYSNKNAIPSPNINRATSLPTISYFQFIRSQMSSLTVTVNPTSPLRIADDIHTSPRLLTYPDATAPRQRMSMCLPRVSTGPRGPSCSSGSAKACDHYLGGESKEREHGEKG